MTGREQWRLWLEYLLAKADGDEATAAQKLDELAPERRT